MPEYLLELDHDRFLSNPLQLIIHCSSYNSYLYNLTYW